MPAGRYRQKRNDGRGHRRSYADRTQYTRARITRIRHNNTALITYYYTYNVMTRIRVCVRSGGGGFAHEATRPLRKTDRTGAR